MPGHARKDIVREGEIGTYHTWSRCVQSSFLCGDDPLTGQSFEHRRLWIKALLEYQASVFAVDVGNYSVLSNHQHLIARTRPDIAAAWSDEEVAWRWKRAWPRWMGDHWAREPSDKEIEEVLAEPHRLPVLRANLASLSWFMARWKEPIARLANAERGTKGHFYEQRFGSRELLDDGANLCCNVYVDLNQIKAGMARSLDESRCSAINDRLRAWRRREAEESVADFQAHSPEGYVLAISEMEHLLADFFLAPIGDHGPSLLVGPSGAPLRAAPAAVEIVLVSDPSLCPPAESEVLEQDVEEVAEAAAAAQEPTLPLAVEEASREGNQADNASFAKAVGHQPNQKKSGSRPQPTWRRHRRLQARRRRRASDHAFLGIPWKQYLEIVQWTARRWGAEVREPPPESLETTLRQWGVQPSSWCAAVEHFGEWFHRAAGHVDKMAQAVQRAGQKWIQGSRHSRDVFT